MTKYYTDAATNKKPLPQPFSAAVMKIAIDVIFPSINYVANELHQLIEIPAGVQVVDYDIHFPDIDSNGTPTIVCSIGTENAGGTDLGTVWDAALTAGQSAAVVRAATANCAQESTAAARKVSLKFTAIAATYAGLGKTGQVILHLRG
ncbi:hypothetical protein [Polaromonas sp.]|uniref:hypothetical protein n=1 Tax=Polaromonas sp. TaxID=1869339 RepID=UPI0032666AF0